MINVKGNINKTRVETPEKKLFWKEVMEAADPKYGTFSWSEYRTDYDDYEFCATCGLLATVAWHPNEWRSEGVQEPILLDVGAWTCERCGPIQVQRIKHNEDL